MVNRKKRYSLDEEEENIKHINDLAHKLGYVVLIFKYIDKAKKDLHRLKIRGL